MPAVAYPHITLSEKGVPIIEGTRTKVVQIVLDQLAYHWDAEEIQRQHPHLTLAQIHSALAYYYDNQKEIDQDIEARTRRAQQIKTSLGDSPIQLKLKELGLVP